MPKEMISHRANLTILYKGGRLPSWYQLSQEERQVYEQAHVDLMLTVAQEQQLKRLEGFRLITPQQHYERFWLIEFETLPNAEAWIKAEMAPPYGHYGFYEYDLAHPWRSAELTEWVTRPSEPVIPRSDDPHQIPTLRADQDSIVVLLFERGHLESVLLIGEEGDGAAHHNQLRATASKYNLMQLEAFELIGSKDDWHRVWVAEYPTLAGAEAWINAWVSQRHGNYKRQTFQLARKWAPAYFAAWVAA